MDKMSIDEMIDELAQADNNAGWYDFARGVENDKTTRIFYEKSFLTFRYKTQVLCRNLHDILKELTWR